KTTLYCPRLIERHEELSALLDLARQAAAGTGALAAVAGEAGIGKTRLLTEFRRSLPSTAASFGAACLEFAPAALGPIQSILGAIAADSRFGLGSDTFEWSLGHEIEDRFTVFGRIRDTLRRASSKAPIAIVLDDLQWADTATLELVQFLTDELATARVLIVLSYRSDALLEASPLQRLVGRLQRRTTSHFFTLEPLAQSAIAELIDATLAKHGALSADALRDVRTKSEGNPLFAEELLKAAVDRSGATPIGAPISLRAVFLERLRKFSADDVHLLEVAALIGRRFRAAFLAQVGARPESSVAAFLRLAVDEHLFTEDQNEPGWFTFRHALVQEAILSRVLLFERQLVHSRIAQAIEREPDAHVRVTELSDHYWLAAAFEECTEYAMAAAEQARARYAYFEAAEQFERALACGINDDAARAALHESAASAHFALGNAEKSVQHFEVASALFEQLGETARAADICLQLARALRRHGDTIGAFAAVARAARIERETPDECLRVRLLIQVAQLHELARNWDEAATSLEEASHLLHLATSGDAVRFYISRAALRFTRPNREGWQADAQEAARVARASGDPLLVALALSNYGVDAIKIGRLDAALPALQEVVATSPRYGSLQTITFARLGYVQALLLGGRLRDARAQLYLALAERHESLAIQVLIAQLGITLSLVLRDHDLLERCHTKALVEKAFAAGDPALSAPLAAAVAEKHLADGDNTGALTMLQRMLTSLPEDEVVCELLLPVALCCS
ncbi:MAG TPA: AAA family ATPase, partial [Candidatus Baltobacteraceae bacterium]